MPVARYPLRVSRFYLAHLASRPLSEEGGRLAAHLLGAISAAAGGSVGRQPR